MNKLKFIEDGHLYEYDHCNISSVSQILSLFAVGDILNKYIRDNPDRDTSIFDMACKYGNKVHETIVNMIDGKEIEMKRSTSSKRIYDISLVGYNFLENSGFKVIHKEEPMINKSKTVAGTPDIIAEKSNDIYVIDWKTNEQSDSKFELYNLVKYEHQLVFYMMIGEDNYGIKFKDGIIAHLYNGIKTYGIRNIEDKKKKINEMIALYYDQNYASIVIKSIIQMWNNGKKPSEIAEIFDIMEGEVMQTVKKYQL